MEPPCKSKVEGKLVGVRPTKWVCNLPIKINNNNQYFIIFIISMFTPACSGLWTQLQFELEHIGIIINLSLYLKVKNFSQASVWFIY